MLYKSSKHSISTRFQTVNEFGLAVKGKKNPIDLNRIYCRKETSLHYHFFPRYSGPVLQSMLAQTWT